jgi:hypothetical protein
VPAATASSYTTAPLTAANDGSRFRVTLATAGSTTATPSAVLTVGQLKFTSIGAGAGQVTLEWSGNAVLEESATVTGPWTVSANQNNPQTISAAGTRFFRLRQ